VLPLNQRLVAPAVRRPDDSAELTWRPASRNDLDAIFECQREMDKADHPHWLTPLEELEEDFTHSHVTLDTDSLVAREPGGQVVAWGLAVLSPGQESLVRSILFGGVRPSYRGKGLGRQLLAWQHDRGLEQLAASDKPLPGWLVVFAQESQTGARALYERFGFSIARYFLELTRTLNTPIAPKELAGELRLESYDQRWAEATRLARNEAFRDHWGSQPVNEEIWESFVSRSIIRPDLSFLAIASSDDGSEEVAGFVISSVNEEDWDGQGYSSAYIDLVGVTRAWRGRGVAAALLTRTLEAVAAAGLDRAVLDVDSDSPTGALGLYTGVGFTEASRSLNFNRVF
jgi:ribosomal protein S18 acetylase RimI-like enzyme